MGSYQRYGDTNITRCFVVGTPRSGTTLFQSFLAAHPQISTVPETAFFIHIDPQKRALRSLHLGKVAALERFAKILGTIGESVDCEDIVSSFGLAYRHSLVKRFETKMDSIAREHRAKCWVEKTPRHLHRLADIRKDIPAAHVIHIIRDGLDVAKSMHRVTNESPEQWNGARTLEQSAKRWLMDLELSRQDRNRPNTYFVRYETLVQDPETVLRWLCEQIGLEFEPSMIQKRNENVHKVLSSNAPWNSNLDKAVQNRKAEQHTDEIHLAKDIIAAGSLDWLPSCPGTCH